MKTKLLFVFLILLSCRLQAQKTDTWSNFPPAQDDRYTNPKSAIYAGPNGWWNFGEIRVKDNPTYSYKGAFTENTKDFYHTNSKELLTLFINLGTDTPKNGIYTMANETNLSANKVQVSFSDVSNDKIKEWTAKSGTLEIKKINNFLYFKARDLKMGATGLNNKNDAEILVGFEGAVKIYE